MAGAGEGEGHHFVCTSVPLKGGSDDGSILEAVRYSNSFWAPYTTLKYYYFSDGQSAEEEKAVSNAFDEWNKVGMNITFRRTRSLATAHLRVGFRQDGRSWSTVGTDAIGQRRTMNFGWSLLSRSESRNNTRLSATALHEIGHAICFQHEHQNPNAGITWDRAAVIAEMARSQSPPWTEADCDVNIFALVRRLDNGAVLEGSNFDKDSIMNYPFESNFIIAPPAVKATGLLRNVVLSAQDKAWAKKWYPTTNLSRGLEGVDKNAAPAPSSPVVLALWELQKISGSAVESTQVSFFTFKPSESRKYVLQLVGNVKARVSVLDNIDGEHEPLAHSNGDTDTQLKLVLGANRDYLITVRTGECASEEYGIVIY